MSKVNIFKVRVFFEGVYDRNNHFGFIQIPKPKMADTFGLIPKPHFKKRNLVTDSMGYSFPLKGPLP